MKSFNYKICFERNELLSQSIDKKKKKQTEEELASRSPEGDRLNEQIRMINGTLGIYKCFRSAWKTRSQIPPRRATVDC